MTQGRRITCQSVHSGILFQDKRAFVDSGIMWKFSMTPMGFNRWTDTNETFPYHKRKRLTVVMLFLFCLLFILCMCVFFAVLVSFIFYLFIHSFIYLLLASLTRAPKLFLGCKIRSMRIIVDWLFYYPGYSLWCDDDNTHKTHVDEIERFRVNFQSVCRL